MRLRTGHLTIAIIALAAVAAKDVHGPRLTSGVPILAVALAPYWDEAWIGK